ncbi:EamA family transporter RarD [Moraxella haemolytica]|uniref:EamA family transporter RarD n=1 Tax=Moraxella haemolytica TaxID=2904119 RepID=UPI0025429774|nr:EamA family transporter RarD [Moraxella sp. ZY171148]WII95381.1 EamA family transporter RarD [Moraxella sp. ZY171148]
MSNNTSTAINQSTNTSRQKFILGVVLAVFANVLFGVLYSYGQWLSPLSGTSVFLWRMVMILGCLLIFLVFSGQIKSVIGDLKAVHGVKAWAWLLLPTPIFGSQLWLFMWAPLNQQGVQTAMGYFLFPLVMVLFGCIFFKEKLTKVQWLAVLLAVAGVALEIMRTGELSWATFWVCMTYPIYYVMRRVQKVRAITGMFVDAVLIAPFCLIYLLMYDQNVSMVLQNGWLFLKVVGLGVISILALQSHLEANRLLPVSLFGLVGYLEPALLFLLAVTVLGGTFTLDMLASYGLIWAGILCLIVQGMSTISGNKNKPA